jgi:hypothetical protein
MAVTESTLMQGSVTIHVATLSIHKDVMMMISDFRNLGSESRILAESIGRVGAALTTIDGANISYAVSVQGASATTGGNRQVGGRIEAGRPFGINEGAGQTEVFTTTSGRQFLLAGESGNVQPAAQAGQAGDVTYVNEYNFGDINVGAGADPGAVRDEILEAIRLADRRDPFNNRARRRGRL